MRTDYFTFSSEKTYNFFLAVLTILNGYTLFFAGTFSLGMMVAAIYSLLGCYKLFTSNRIKGIYYVPFIIAIFYIFLTLISFFVFSDTSLIASKDVFYNTAKVGVWAIMISITGYYFFDYRTFVRYMIYVALIGTIVLIVQFIAITLLGISIPNAIDFGIIRPTYTDYIYSTDSSAAQIRLSSIWMEPAQYGNYVVAMLAILLFDDKLIIRKRSLLIVIFASGIILSTSSGAIYMMAIFFLIYLYFRSGSYKYIMFIPMMFLALVGLLLYSNFGLMEQLEGSGTIGYSIYYAITKLQLWRDSSRIGGSFDAIISLSEYGIHKYIGLGMGNEIAFLEGLGRDFTYLNSVAKTVTWTGYIGLMSYISLPLSLFIRNKGNRLGSVLTLFCLLGGFILDYGIVQILWCFT